MGGRTKRIFLSDIHMGDDRSMSGDNPYCWFRENIEPLAQFLEEQRTSSDVKEVVILGDLFDDWVVPADVNPLISFNTICSNKANKPVIEALKALAAGDCDVKLAYVPGNHDMAMHAADMGQVKWFMETVFPGIRFFSDAKIPVGSFNVGAIAAEHGHRYGLFNAPYPQPGCDSLLPLGYFITRVIAYKVAKQGKGEDIRNIFIKFIREFKTQPNFIEAMFAAVANDAGLNPRSVNLSGITGYPSTETVSNIGQSFKDLFNNWNTASRKVDVLSAIEADCEYLNLAAREAYFNHFGNNAQIVIFGHTHVATMDPQGISLSDDPSTHDSREPWYNIYANCGTWVDANGYGGTYVETEEVPDQRRHYVRVIEYRGPDNIKKLHEGFVTM